MATDPKFPIIDPDQIRIILLSFSDGGRGERWSYNQVARGSVGVATYVRETLARHGLDTEAEPVSEADLVNAIRKLIDGGAMSSHAIATECVSLMRTHRIIDETPASDRDAIQEFFEGGTS